MKVLLILGIFIPNLHLYAIESVSHDTRFDAFRLQYEAYRD